MVLQPSLYCLLPHQMCLNHSNQFTHLGNIAETSKYVPPCPPPPGCAPLPTSGTKNLSRALLWQI